MDWISVRDKLPPNFKEVLVIDDSDEMFVSFTRNGKWQNVLEIKYKPTHWIELPELPKRDNKWD